MPDTRGRTLVRQWGERFRKDALAARIVAGLKHQADVIWQGAFDLLKRESPEYRNAVDDKFTAESKSHCNELLRMIVAVASRRVGKSESDPFAFVRTHAQWRARHQVPLTASLHAYRIAHRTYWNITREALLRHPQQKDAIRSLAMLTDFWIEFFDHVGAVLAEAHAVEEGLIVAQGSRVYVGLLNDLLKGTAPQDGEARRLSTVCGIHAGAALAVLVARPLAPTNGQAIDAEVTLRAAARLIEQELPSATFGKLMDVRDGEMVALASSAGATARDLAKALRKSAGRAANGIAVGMGISLDASDIAALPRALREARLALDFASVKAPLVHFADIDLMEFVLRRSDGAAARLVPQWVQRLRAPADGAGDLALTVRTFADCSLNVKRTANRLDVHANTVYFRLNRVRKLTGIDPRTFAGASLLLTALKVLEIHEPADKPAA
jgi:hypothetical protein